MKCQLSCGCCGPDNCLKLWTPKRPDGDVCDWFLNVDGDIDIPRPGASWSMVRRPSDGGEIADASTLYRGYRASRKLRLRPLFVKGWESQVEAGRMFDRIFDFDSDVIGWSVTGYRCFGSESAIQR